MSRFTSIPTCPHKLGLNEIVHIKERNITLKSKEVLEDKANTHPSKLDMEIGLLQNKN